MFTSLLSVLKNKWVLTSAAAAALAIPGIAQANDRFDDHRVDERRIDDRRFDDRRDHFGMSIRIGEPAPRFEERRVQVWVPAVYRTVCDQRWIEPVYRTDCQQVLVPAVYENREIRSRDRWGRTVCRTEQVLISPAHYEKRDVQVLVCAGHYENVDRQEVVVAGHYETRIDRVASADPRGVVNPRVAGIDFRIGR